MRMRALGADTALGPEALQPRQVQASRVPGVSHPGDAGSVLCPRSGMGGGARAGFASPGRSCRPGWGLQARSRSRRDRRGLGVAASHSPDPRMRARDDPTQPDRLLRPAEGCGGTVAAPHFRPGAGRKEPPRAGRDQTRQGGGVLRRRGPGPGVRRAPAVTNLAVRFHQPSLGGRECGFPNSPARRAPAAAAPARRSLPPLPGFPCRSRGPSAFLGRGRSAGAGI